MSAKTLIDSIDIVESGLARLTQHMAEHDTAMISAFRTVLVDCVEESQCTGHKPSHEENLERNRELLAALLQAKYGATAIDGSYIEDPGPMARETRENSYFVVNLIDDRRFFETLQKLGRYYCQDSVMLKPKNGAAYLVGTNRAWPGLGKTVEFPGFQAGSIPGKIFSRVKNRPFGFLQTKESCGVAASYLVDSIGSEVLKKIESASYRV